MIYPNFTLIDKLRSNVDASLILHGILLMAKRAWPKNTPPPSSQRVELKTFFVILDTLYYNYNLKKSVCPLVVPGSEISWQKIPVLLFERKCKLWPTISKCIFFRSPHGSECLITQVTKEAPKTNNTTNNNNGNPCWSTILLYLLD